MDLYLIKIHGYNCFFHKKGKDWFIADKIKGKFTWTPTLIPKDRQKRAKKICVQELLINYMGK